jgi:hypothetical protein
MGYLGRLAPITALLTTCAGLAACGGPVSVSKTSGLAHSEKEKNAAILVGAANGLDGVSTDLREFPKLLQDPQYGFDFQTVNANPNASADDILKSTGDLAKASDSLLWYFSGHGNTGIMLASDRTFTFHEVADAIRQARNGVPLKRLIVLVDSCFSGSFVDGDDPIIEGQGKTAKTTRGNRCRCLQTEEMRAATATNQFANETLFQTLGERDTGIYEQAFVMASSSKDEESADLGADQGGAFTYALRTTIASLKKSDDAATFSDMASQTTTLTNQVGQQTPVYRGFPTDTLMKDALFHYSN